MTTLGDLASSEEVVNNRASDRRIEHRYTCNPSYTPAAECFCVRFSPETRYLACSLANGYIHIYKAEHGAQERVLYLREKGAGPGSVQLPCTQVRWRPQQGKGDSALLSVSAEVEGRVNHWDVKSGKCLHSITEASNQIYCLDYFSDGLQFATAGRDRLIRVYDESEKKLIMSLEGGDAKKEASFHSNRIMSLKYHPIEQNIILSGGWDNTVQVWDTRIGHSVRSIWHCVLYGDAMDISSDGKQILTGSYRPKNALQMWDFGSGELIENIEWKSEAAGQTSQLFAAEFSKDPESSMIMAGGSSANEAKFFQRNPGGPCTPSGSYINLPKPVFTVDFAPDGHLAAIGCGDGKVRVVEIK